MGSISPRSLRAVRTARKLMGRGAAAAHLCQQVHTEPGATGTWDFLPAFNTEAAGSTVIRVFLNGESILITQKD